MRAFAAILRCLSLHAILVAAWLGLPAHPAGALAVADPAAAKRVLTLLTVVGEEYRESMDERGALVRPLEYEEARSFLAEARMRWEQLGVQPDGASVTAGILAISYAIEAKQPVEGVIAQIETARAAVTQATGVEEAIYPPQQPSPRRGAAVFTEYCASCHGERGDGHGPDSARLERKPANFTDPSFMRGETPYDHIHVITLGKRGAAMPAWEDVLSLQERWDVLSYVWRLAVDRRQLAEGQGMYLSQCASCHGPTGDGTGPYASTLLTPAPSLALPPSLARRTDDEIFEAIRDGVAGTAMPAFRPLGDTDTWKLVAFVRSLSLGGADGDGGDAPPDRSAGNLQRFGRLLRLAGSEYARAVAGGTPVSEQDLTKSEVLIAQAAAVAPAIVAMLANPSASALPQQIEQLATLIREHARPEVVETLIATITATLPTESAPAAAPMEIDVLTKTRQHLSDALAAYQRKDPLAISLVSDAYFAFEPLEARLAVAAPQLTRQIEGRFLDLRGAMTQAGSARPAELVGAIGRDLDAVRAALAPQLSPTALFVQSAGIILREGFEIVLIITALLTYVRKSGNPQMQRQILTGAALGVGLSLITAFGFAQLFRGASANAAESLAGFTMLLASGVLFWVSYWLISKAEADKWQRYIQGKVKTALSSGSRVALAGAAFLAVFREGVETVLFYQALFGSAAGAHGVVVGGLAAGSVALGVVALALTHFGMRVPIGPFFLGTSILLYYMATVFAGQGVAELQETGWIAVTPLPGVPRIPFLGLYPSVETVLAQGLFVAALLYAIAVIARRRRRARAQSSVGSLHDEVARLRELAMEIRAELSRRPVLAEQARQRLDGLIERVVELEGQMQLGLPPRGGVKPASH